MPELPEVETIRRGLLKIIVGRRMERAEVFCDKSFIGHFQPGGVQGQRRFGKALVIDLDNGWSLMIHLRMTGQLIWWGNDEGASGSENAGGDLKLPGFAGGHPSENFVSSLPNKQTRVALYMEGGTLYFNDQRKFGFIKVIPTAEVEEDKFIRKLAPEPWVMSGEDLFARLKRHKNSAVKSVILDQGVVCGLGNIYADESLWRAGIHPLRRAGEVCLDECERLIVAMREVMDESLAAGGSTIRNYVKADGTRGNYLDKFAKVYGREGEPCARCGTLLVKTKVGGRGTRYCPVCQRKESDDYSRNGKAVR
jgi:formamidopyrimidine-DNA glycosylase